MPIGNDRNQTQRDLFLKAITTLIRTATMRLASSHFLLSPGLAYNIPFGLHTPLLFVHSTALPARLSLCNGMCSPTASSMSQTRLKVGAIGEAVNEPGQVYLSFCPFPASYVVFSRLKIDIHFSVPSPSSRSLTSALLLCTSTASVSYRRDGSMSSNMSRFPHLRRYPLKPSLRSRSTRSSRSALMAPRNDPSQRPGHTGRDKMLWPPIRWNWFRLSYPHILDNLLAQPRQKALRTLEALDLRQTRPTGLDHPNHHHSWIGVFHDRPMPESVAIRSSRRLESDHELHCGLLGNMGIGESNQEQKHRICKSRKNRGRRGRLRTQALLCVLAQPLYVDHLLPLYDCGSSRHHISGSREYPQPSGLEDHVSIWDSDCVLCRFHFACRGLWRRQLLWCGEREFLRGYTRLHVNTWCVLL
jgi:hypothetical protein